MDWFDRNSVLVTEKSLDYLWQRQKLTLQNIANGETPGYKAKYATFEDELNRSLSKYGDDSRPQRVSEMKQEILGSKLWIHESQNESVRLDGNNVQIDVEQLELARTQMQYQFALRQITDEFSRLRTVITGQ